MREFEELYRDYFDAVFRFLRRLTGDELLAEDLTEETFFKALRSLGSFRGDCDVRVWLCQIGKNAYFTHLKRQKRFAAAELPPALSAPETEPERLLLDQELARALQKALRELAEPYREVFSLRVFGELPFREIGLLLGKSEHWACVTYHRAREKLRREMEEER